MLAVAVVAGIYVQSKHMLQLSWEIFAILYKGKFNDREVSHAAITFSWDLQVWLAQASLQKEQVSGHQWRALGLAGQAWEEIARVGQALGHQSRV